MSENDKAGNLPLAGDVQGSFRRGVVRAALASGLAEAVNRVLTIALSIATARALLPSQVGVLALAVIVIGIVSLVAACSETAGVIGRYEGTDGQHALAAAIVRAVIVAILVSALYPGLPMIARLLGGAEGTQPELIGLLRVLILLPILELFAAYPRVLVQRRLDLTYLAGVGLFQVILHVALSITLLIQGFGPIGVAWSSIIAGALSAMAVWLRLFGSRWPKWEGFPDRTLRLSVVSETLKVFTGSFLGYLNGRADNLLVAGVLGPTAMSFYGMAWSASRVAPQILAQAFGYVLVPVLAKIQTDEDRIKRVLHESLRHSYLLLAPVASILFVTGPSLVTTVLGQKWLPIVPCLQVMSITILLGPLVSTFSSLLVATGRAHIAGLATAWQLVVLAMLIIPLSRMWGVSGAAYGDMMAVGALTTALLFATPIMRKPMRQLVVPSILLPLGSAAISGLLAWAGSLLLSTGLLKLLVQVAIILTIYPAVISVFGGRSALLDLISLVRDTVRRASVASRVAPTQA